jgi:hypothetical protein
MWEVVNACIITNNMLIESERANPMHDDLPYDLEGPLVKFDHEVPVEFENFLQNHRQIRNQDTHKQLQDDLVAHLWARRGNTLWVSNFYLFSLLVHYFIWRNSIWYV